ncbi:MAG: ATP-binding protein [Nanoarchaeota archaeon]|nr:ATP-binding protein [Nanoarchaeota archaeon]
MLIMHLNEICEIERNIKMKKSTLLVGPKGIGKTTILRKLKGIYIEYPSARQTLSSIAKHYEVRFFRWATIPEQLELVKKYLPKSVLLIDNYEDIRRPTMKLVEKLISEGAVVVAASERKLYFLDEKVYVKRLSREESFSLVEELLPSADKIVHEIIINMSLGNPGKIVTLARDYTLGVKNLEVVPFDKESIVSFFLKLKPEIPERIDILPIWLLFVMGFGALTAKVILFSKGNFHDAYMIAAFGYTSLIIYRLVKR